MSGPDESLIVKGERARSMSVRLIAGRAGCGKTTYCVEAVRAELARSPVDGPRLIMLVPEQATLQIERLLLEGAPFRALGRCEIVGFRRLARLIFAESAGALPTVVTP